MGSGLSDSGTVRDHEEDGVYPCEFGGIDSSTLRVRLMLGMLQLSSTYAAAAPAQRIEQRGTEGTRACCSPSNVMTVYSHVDGRDHY